jgi:hypothetical protein
MKKKNGKKAVEDGANKKKSIYMKWRLHLKR